MPRPASSRSHSATSRGCGTSTSGNWPSRASGTFMWASSGRACLPGAGSGDPAAPRCWPIDASAAAPDAASAASKTAAAMLRPAAPFEACGGGCGCGGSASCPALSAGSRLLCGGGPRLPGDGPCLWCARLSGESEEGCAAWSGGCRADWHSPNSGKGTVILWRTGTATSVAGTRQLWIWPG